MGGLNAEEKAAWSGALDFFQNLEKTELSRSYKIVLLLAMLDGETLMPRLAIGEIARRVVDIAQRIHRLSEDFSIDWPTQALFRNFL